MFYWFSKQESEKRFADRKGICSGLFGRKRKLFTRCTRTKEKPIEFSDFKYVGEAEPDELDFRGGIFPDELRKKNEPPAESEQDQMKGIFKFRGA